MEKQNVWEEVLAKTDIVNVISEYVPLTKQGKNFRACCPFHGEKTPSFIVSLNKQIFRCFGCGKSGNAIKFLEYYKNISPLEALKILAKKNNIDISTYLLAHEKNNAKNYEQIKILDVLKEANNYFKYQLIVNDKNEKLNDFFKQRLLDKKLINYFEIGYAPQDNSIYVFLKNKNFDDFAINNSSLVTSNVENKNFFNNRITFPIKDEQGNVVAFSARDITNLASPKYLNSAETIVFKKSKVLFNFYNAKQYIKDTNEVYLVEGQFDVVALYRIDVKNAIALMGTNLTKSHLELLKGNTINLFFDNDNAGINATYKNMKIILYYANELNLKINFINNTLQKDPDEVYKIDNGKTLTKILNNKIDLSQFLLNNYLNQTFFNLNNEQKNLRLKQVFEIAYYMQSSIYTLFKNEIIAKKILTNDEYIVFENQYLKPNFPSDKTFKVDDYKNNVETQPKKQFNKSPYDFDIDNANFLVNENDYYSKTLNQDNTLKKKTPLLGRGLDMALIFKAILAQPSYLEKWSDVDILSFNQNGGDPEILRELIIYTATHLKKIQTNNVKSLFSLILNDNNLNIEDKKRYINIIEKINYSTSEMQILDESKFNKLFAELVNEVKTSPKTLLINTSISKQKGDKH